MEKEIIEQIFMIGVAACYETLDPNTGICDKERLDKLKDDAISLFLKADDLKQI